MLMLKFYQAVRDEELRYVSCYCKSQICFYLMSQQTILMQNLCYGLSNFFQSMKEQWLRSPMIATS